MILAQAFDATYWGFLGRGVGAILLYAVIGTLLMLVGFWAIDLTTPGKLPAMVRGGLPNAVTITSAGMLSMAFIIVRIRLVSSTRQSRPMNASSGKNRFWPSCM